MNRMMRCTVTIALSFCLGIVELIPLSSPSDDERNITFRWTTGLDLDKAFCATGINVDDFYDPNDTSEDTENYKIGVKFYSTVEPETRKENCASNESHFMLIGNPGIVKHLVTGQCLGAKTQTYVVHGIYPNITFVTSKFLDTGRKCDPDDPDVARFQLDKNRPHRLSFIPNTNSTNGTQEEWCIRERFLNKLQVVPNCMRDNPYTGYQPAEVYVVEVD